MLNSHATALSESSVPLGKAGGVLYSLKFQETALGKLQAAFIDFITSVEEGGLRPNYLADTSAPEKDAYWQYWKCHSNL